MLHQKKPNERKRRVKVIKSEVSGKPKKMDEF